MMPRREIREHVFRLLFLREFYNDEDLKEQVILYLEGFEGVPEEYRDLLRERVEEIYPCIPDLDARVNCVAKGWRTGRMGKVDLAVIRLALYEIFYDDAIPMKVAVNEAVELAKKFGGDDSPAFINGVLGKLIREGNGQ